MPQRCAIAPHPRRGSLIPCTSAQPQAAHIPHQPRALAIAAQCALLASLSAGAMGLLLEPEFAHAQTARGAQASQPAQVKSYNIPASSLAEALRAFASAAGVELTVDGTLVQGRQSRGLNGNYSVAGGFDVLLGGHNLEAVRQGNGSYALRVVDTLPEVTVTAPGRGSGRGDVATLPEVVVTAGALGVTEGTGSYTTESTSAATGLSLSLRETPQSVTVFTRQRIDDQQLNSLADVAQQTPGLYLSNTGSGTDIGGYSGIYSRGFAVSSYQIDGLPTSGAAFTFTGSGVGMTSFDTAIYDSVTVVRGATGLLTGAGDPSASVGLTHKRPTHQFQGSLEGSLGRWDKRRVVADVGGPLNRGGTVRGRLVGLYDESSSWISRYQGARNTVYGVVEADLMPDTLVSLTLEHNNERSNSAESYGFPVLYSDDGTLTPFTRHDAIFAEWSNWHNRRSSVQIALEHAFNEDWGVKINYGHTDRQFNQKRNNLVGISSDHVAGRITRVVNNLKYDSDSVSATLNGRYSIFETSHDLVAGFNSHRLTQKQGPGNGADSLMGYQLPIINGIPQIPEPDWGGYNSNLGGSRGKTNQSGFYLATRLKPTDDFALILGGRWSDWDYRSISASGVSSGQRNYSNVFTPYAGVVYDLTNHLSVYGSYTEIFNPQSARDIAGNLLDPEEGINYELGLKGDWFNGRLNASFAVFETVKDNLAVADGNNITPEGGQAYIAENDTKTRGWELEIQGELARGMEHARWLLSF